MCRSLGVIKATTGAPAWALAQCHHFDLKFQISVIIQFDPTSSRMVTTVTLDRLDSSNSWHSGDQIRLPWRCHVRSQLPPQDWVLTPEPGHCIVLKQSPRCPGPTCPTKGPPQPRREGSLLADPQLLTLASAGPDPPLRTPEMMAWAWCPEPCLAP